MGWRDTIQDIEPKDKVVKKGWRDTVKDVEETGDPFVETLKDVATTAPQGISTWADEAQAGVQAGYKSLVEGKPFQETYEQDVADIRSDIAEARKRSPIATGVGEIGTSIGSSFIPGLGALAGAGKFSHFAPTVARGAFEGLGASEDKLSTEGAVEAGYGAGLAGVGSGISSALKRVTSTRPESMRALQLGARTAELKDVGIKEREAIAKELKDMGLFQNMKVDFDVQKGKFIPKGKSLESVEKSTRSKLKDRLSEATEKIQNEKMKLLGAKAKDPIDSNRFFNDLDTSIYDYATAGPDTDKRLKKATDVVNVLINDMKVDMKLHGSSVPTVEVLEKAKSRIKSELGKYGKNPLLQDTEGLEDFYKDMYRKINGELRNTISDPNYQRYNDLQQRFLTAESDLTKAIASELSSKGNVSIGGMMERTLKGPEAMGAYATVGETLNKFPLKQLKKPAMSVIEDAPFEAIRYLDPSTNQSPSRSPQSIGISPAELIKYRIPRSTQGILENKDMVLAKIVQAGASDEMIDTITDALNGDADDLANIAPLVMSQFPTLFEKSKYKTFDGKFIDPMDKSRAADEISKRDDLDSVKRFQMINDINKHNKMPEGL